MSSLTAGLMLRFKETDSAVDEVRRLVVSDRKLAPIQSSGGTKGEQGRICSSTQQMDGTGRGGGRGGGPQRAVSTETRVAAAPSPSPSPKASPSGPGMACFRVLAPKRVGPSLHGDRCGRLRMPSLGAQPSAPVGARLAYLTRPHHQSAGGGAGIDSRQYASKTAATNTDGGLHSRGEPIKNKLLALGGNKAKWTVPRALVADLSHAPASEPAFAATAVIEMRDDIGAAVTAATTSLGTTLLTAAVAPTIVEREEDYIAMLYPDSLFSSRLPTDDDDDEEEEKEEEEEGEDEEEEGEEETPRSSPSSSL